ncbi:MAG: hypothetical protein ACJ790_05195 [Myxococcaceae bacterium]
MDEVAAAREDPKKSLRWTVIAIAIAIALALIAPALPGGPHRPKPMEHRVHDEASVTATTELPPPPAEEPPRTDAAPGLWPAVFFIESGNMNQPAGSGR